MLLMHTHDESEYLTFILDTSQIKCKPGTTPNLTKEFIKYNYLNRKLEIQMVSYSSGR